MTQEIIVYRNPGEQMMWDAFRNNPEIIISFLAAFIIFLISASIIDKVARSMLRARGFSYNTISQIQLWMSAILGFATLITLLKVL